jgi:hypothetical protein
MLAQGFEGKAKIDNTTAKLMTGIKAKLSMFPAAL